MSFYSATWSCEPCDIAWEDTVPREERDCQVCVRCGKPAVRQLGMPMVLKASFLDGTRRFDHLRAQDRIDRALSEAKTFDDRKKLLIEKDKVAEKAPKKT